MEADPNRNTRPTLKLLAETLKERPWSVMRPWLYPLLDFANFEEPQDYPMEGEALNLFKLFSRCVWEVLDSSHVRQPTPERFNSAESVLEFWTVPSRLDALIHPQLMPIPGNSREDFNSKFSLFFPPLNQLRKGGWRGMEDTYIKEYWSIIRRKSDKEVTEFEKCLLQLFGRCQCLPNASSHGPWIPGENGEVLLIVNPGEYHADLVLKPEKAKRKKRKVTKSYRDFGESILTVLRPDLPQQQRKKAWRLYGKTVQKEDRRKKKLTMDNAGETDDEQPPRPRFNTWRRGRGGRQVGHPRKQLLEEKLSASDSSESDSGYVKQKESPKRNRM